MRKERTASPRPILAVGNSDSDRQMIEYVTDGNGRLLGLFATTPTPSASTRRCTNGSAKRAAGWKVSLAVLPLLGLVSFPALAQRPSSEEVVARAFAESAFAGELEKVRQLASAGVSVNARDAEQRTPLMWAAFNGHTPVAAFLLEQGAEVDAKDNNGRSALMYASSGPFPEVVKLLFENGAEANTRGTLEGFTALMTAAAEGQLEVVRWLLIYGADPDIQDRDGDTAESFAEEKGHAAVVSLLKNPPARAGASRKP
jgi:ankyrin repeat protein